MTGMFMPHTKMYKGLRVTVLMALRERPLTGYAIAEHIEAMYGLFWPEMVYPTLQMLEDEGYVLQIEQHGKKEYALTDEGKQFLQERSKIVEWLDWWARRPKIWPKERCGDKYCGEA